jgi:hypothetical protein
MNAQQKLVSVFLHDIHDKTKGGYGDPASNPLFGVTEHLGAFLTDGWRVKDFKVLGGAGGCLSGWIVALLEKPG